jgi:hypothetical protein
MLKEIKLGLSKKPIYTVYKLCLLPLCLFVALLFAVTLIIVNLRTDEAKDFIKEVI